MTVIPGHNVPRSRDPFLWAHEIRPFVYDISSALRPASIRDQLVRGTLLARRAVERGVLHADDRPLLVVGGGAAGVACALEAIRHNIPTVLVESKAELFSRQRECTTRHIDPTLYDWPSIHWSYGIYPWHDDEPSSLTVVAGPANELVTRWTAELARAQARRPGLLRVLMESVLEPRPQREGNVYRVRIRSAAAVETLVAGMIVFATGPGIERDDEDTFRSFRFWDNDPLADPLLHVKKVLISGGGDGAAQDLLRVVFRPDLDPARLVHQLRITDAFARAAHTITEHDNAVFQWCRNAADEHQLGKYVQDRFHVLLDDIWREQGPAMSRVFESHARPRRPHIVVAYRCGHFSRMYTVNRLLAGLVARWAAATGATDIELRPNTAVCLPVECLHEAAPALHASACFGRPHRVRFERQTCHGAVPSLFEFAEEFDAVLLRHGGAGNVPYAAWFRARERHVRQIIPAHLAHLA
jgi:hypothetical protein